MSRYKTLFPVLALFSLGIQKLQSQPVREIYENGNLRSAGFLKDSLQGNVMAIESWRDGMQINSAFLLS